MSLIVTIECTTVIDSMSDHSTWMGLTNGLSELVTLDTLPMLHMLSTGPLMVELEFSTNELKNKLKIISKLLSQYYSALYDGKVRQGRSFYYRFHYFKFYHSE